MNAYLGRTRKYRLSIIPGVAKCRKCKTVWDLEVMRTRKDYAEPGICPKCGGYLRAIKERY